MRTWNCDQSYSGKAISFNGPDGSGDAHGVVERGLRDLRGVDDARLEQVAVVALEGVEAPGGGFFSEHFQRQVGPLAGE